MKLIIMIIFSSMVYASDINIDSSLINSRIESAIIIIKKDSLFNSLMENEYGKAISFFIEDTLYCPYVSTSDLKKIYPDSNYTYIFNKTNYFQDCNKRFEIKPIVHLSSKYKKCKSNYSLSIGIMDYNLLNYFIVPIKPKTKSKAYEIFILYNDKNKVIRFYSERFIAE